MLSEHVLKIVCFLILSHVKCADKKEDKKKDRAAGRLQCTYSRSRNKKKLQKFSILKSQFE